MKNYRYPAYSAQANQENILERISEDRILKNIINDLNNKPEIGRICEIQKNTYMIRFGTEELSGKLKGIFLKDGLELPVVGDTMPF